MKPRSRTRKPRRGKWKGRVAVGAVLAALALLAWAVLARAFAPQSNTSLTRFDAIIVLGTPADRDGNPTPGQLARVSEAVREYERGVAPRLIFTGAAERNRFVEAEGMARVAQAQGIPPEAIFLEPQARDTVQNACYSARIMKEHGWRSAEVISRASHLQRAGLVLDQLPIEWRTHAAPPLQEQSQMTRAYGETLETFKTMLYLVWARQFESCEP